jgi:carbon storage regulator
MLVLRRKAGEAIVLNGVITIHVLAVEGERVKLGISAPPEVVIVRSELLEHQGPVPGGPVSSGGRWPTGEPRRPPRDRGPGGSGSGESGPSASGSFPRPEVRSPGRVSDRYGEPTLPAPSHNGQVHED